MAAEGWGFTAALATEDAPHAYCDVTVLINDEDGQITDRSALPWIDLAAAPLADPDRLAKALDVAPGILASMGWRITGEWTIAANAAYAPAEPMPQILVSVLDVKGGALGQMPGVTGVWWTDSRWLECTEHLASPFWTPDIDERSAVKTGVVLAGPADPAWCDAHREAAREGWTEVETDGAGGVVSQRRLAGPEAEQAERAYQRFIAADAKAAEAKLAPDAVRLLKSRDLMEDGVFPFRRVLLLALCWAPLANDGEACEWCSEDEPVPLRVRLYPEVGPRHPQCYIDQFILMADAHAALAAPPPGGTP